MSLTTTLGGSLGGRLLSLPFFCANVPAETMPIIAAANNVRLKFVIISASTCYLKSGAWEGEKSRATQNASNLNARRDPVPDHLNQLTSARRTAHPFGHNSHGIVQLSLANLSPQRDWLQADHFLQTRAFGPWPLKYERLPPHSDTHAAHVSAVVKGAHRDSMFPRRHNWKIQRVPLATTVGNAIIRKGRIPR